MVRGIIFASIVGVIGAALWAAIAYYGNIELGLLAWAIGAGVGFAMLAGAQGEAGLHTGIAALVIALATIAIGKFATVELVIRKEVKTVMEQQESELDNNEELAITYIADDVLDEFDAAGRDINYPPTADLMAPSGAMDYPADVWAEARERWLTMNPAERDQVRDDALAQTQTNVDAIVDSIRGEGFKSSFSFFDILWFGLGGFSAFRLGAGGMGEG